MTIYKNALQDIIRRENLSEADAYELMMEILNGIHGPERIAGLLTALSCKGESLSEVKGFVLAMREKAVKLHSGKRVVDTCGTGGDGANTFNISTTAAFIASGAGTTIAKHHNRAVSSRAGSADLLEALGIDIQMDLDKVCDSVNELGIGFCFAPLFHPSMRFAAPARKALGIRTVFNILGPLLNPFTARHQVIGIYDPGRMKFVAELLLELGSERVLILHGLDGLDEASLTTNTRVVELNNGKIEEYVLDPTLFGYRYCSSEDLSGEDAKGNAKITLDILNGKPGPRRDIAEFNAALAIYVNGDGISLEKAVAKSKDAIDNGAALKKLNDLRELSAKAVPA